MGRPSRVRPPVSGTTRSEPEPALDPLPPRLRALAVPLEPPERPDEDDPPGCLGGAHVLPPDDPLLEVEPPLELLPPDELLPPELEDPPPLSDPPPPRGTACWPAAGTGAARLAATTRVQNRCFICMLP
jgi:hypothetical protein